MPSGREKGPQTQTTDNERTERVDLSRQAIKQKPDKPNIRPEGKPADLLGICLEVLLSVFRFPSESHWQVSLHKKKATICWYIVGCWGLTSERQIAYISALLPIARLPEDEGRARVDPNPILLFASQRLWHVALTCRGN